MVKVKVIIEKLDIHNVLSYEHPKNLISNITGLEKKLIEAKRDCDKQQIDHHGDTNKSEKKLNAVKHELTILKNKL